jgi:hypothetical protein
VYQDSVGADQWAMTEPVCNVRPTDSEIVWRSRKMDRNRTLIVKVETPLGSPSLSPCVEMTYIPWRTVRTGTVTGPGEVSFSELSELPHMLSIHPGKSESANDWLHFEMHSLVAHGQTIQVRFRQGRAIHGTVQFEDGTRASGIRIESLLESGLECVSDTLSDDSGSFSARVPLSDANYVLRASAVRGTARLECVQLLSSEDPGPFRLVLRHFQESE